MDRGERALRVGKKHHSDNYSNTIIMHRIKILTAVIKNRIKHIRQDLE
jgi:hypothetical protein